jgi:hypothetical protein
MWKWNLAYRKMFSYDASLMFQIAKIHQTFLSYKDNNQVDFYWFPYSDLLKVIVLVP